MKDLMKKWFLEVMIVWKCWRTRRTHKKFLKLENQLGNYRKQLYEHELKFGYYEAVYRR